MDDFGSETDSEYTSYWRDWVSRQVILLFSAITFVVHCCLVFVILHVCEGKITCESFVLRGVTRLLKDVGFLQSVPSEDSQRKR